MPIDPTTGVQTDTTFNPTDEHKKLYDSLDAQGKQDYQSTVSSTASAGLGASSSREASNNIAAGMNAPPAPESFIGGISHAAGQVVDAVGAKLGEVTKPIVDTAKPVVDMVQPVVKPVVDVVKGAVAPKISASVTPVGLAGNESSTPQPPELPQGTGLPTTRPANAYDAGGKTWYATPEGKIVEWIDPNKAQSTVISPETDAKYQEHMKAYFNENNVSAEDQAYIMDKFLNNPQERQKFFQKTEEERVQYFKDVQNINRATRDATLAAEQRQATYDRNLEDSKRKFALDNAQQKARMDADANNMSIALGTSGRLQSQNMANAVKTQLDLNEQVYNSMIASEDSYLKALGEEFRMNNQQASNEYNDYISQYKSDLLSKIDGLQKTGAMNTKSGLLQAQSFIDHAISATNVAMQSYQYKMAVAGERAKVLADQMKANNQFDAATTQHMGDGYLYTAQGTRMMDSNGKELQANKGQGELVTKNGPIKLNDGSMAMIYQTVGNDGKPTFNTVKVSSPESAGASTIQGLQTMLSSGTLKPEQLKDFNLSQADMETVMKGYNDTKKTGTGTMDDATVEALSNGIKNKTYDSKELAASGVSPADILKIMVKSGEMILPPGFDANGGIDSLANLISEKIMTPEQLQKQFNLSPLDMATIVIKSGQKVKDTAEKGTWQVIRQDTVTDENGNNVVKNVYGRVVNGQVDTGSYTTELPQGANPKLPEFRGLTETINIPNNTDMTGKRGSQCGEFVNDSLGQKVFGDSFEQKKSKINSEVPVIGGAIIMGDEVNGGQMSKYGHVGIVMGVNQEKQTYIVKDSNWDMNGVVQTHDIPMNDPRIAGFYNPGKTAGAAGEGSDVPMDTTESDMYPEYENYIESGTLPNQFKTNSNAAKEFRKDARRIYLERKGTEYGAAGFRISNPDAFMSTKPAIKTQVSTQIATIGAFVQSMDKLEELTKKYGFEIGEFTAEGKEMSAIATDAQMQAKEIYNLGVLNGPDLSLMQKIIPDPSTMLARWQDPVKLVQLGRKIVFDNMAIRAKNIGLEFNPTESTSSSTVTTKSGKTYNLEEMKAIIEKNKKK